MHRHQMRLTYKQQAPMRPIKTFIEVKLTKTLFSTGLAAGVLLASVSLSSCATYNSSGLEVRKRSRLNKESVVVDMRALKTPADIAAEKSQREKVKKGTSTIEVISRPPPQAALEEI